MMTGDAAAKSCKTGLISSWPKTKSMRERAYWSVNLYSMLWDWRMELSLLFIDSSLL